MSTAEPIKLLIVEDNLVSQVGLRAWLGRTGDIQVREATTITEARALFAAGYRPHAIMLDLDLPGETGEGLFPDIARLGGDPPPRTIIASGTTDASRLTKAAEIGPQPIFVFSKPWPAPDVLAAIRGETVAAFASSLPLESKG